jgi:Sec1 family
MLDRNIDLISPFCVQQVYEGLLDETFGIKTTSVTVETKLLNPKWEKKPGESDYTELLLNNEDFLFKEIRGMALGGLGIVTREKLKEIKEVMSEKDNPTNIKELSQYVTKVKSMNIAKRKELLDYHINMASHIRTSQMDLDFIQLCSLEQSIIMGADFKDLMPKLESKMCRQYNIETILRLVSLLSVTKSGLDPKDFDYLRKTFLMCYGYQEIPTLMNLQDAKLVRPKDKVFDWAKIKKVSGETIMTLVGFQFDQRRS